MKPYFEEDGVTLFNGDALTCLREMPSESVQCVVTSPPYWGLRDYGTAQWDGGDEACDHKVRADAHSESSTLAGSKESVGHQKEGFLGHCPHCGAKRIDKQIGLEEIPDDYVSKLVEIFRYAHRALKPEGTLWLNLGDSYYSRGGPEPAQTKWQVDGASNTQNGGKTRKPFRTGAGLADGCVLGLKSKDLVGIPWRVAFALQSDGWYLRSDIVWAKPNPMPESVTDRPTRSHEYIFLLSKSANYYCDMESIAEPVVSDHGSGNGFKRDARLSYMDEDGARGSDVPWTPKNKLTGGPYSPPGQAAHSNARSPRSYNGSTFTRGKTATPHANVGQGERADRDVRNKRDVWTVSSEPNPEAHFATFPPDLIRPCVMAGAPIGGVVLDPFAGSGTTLQVARQMGRAAIGIELNPEYCKLVVKRIGQRMLDLQEVTNGTP